MYRIIYRNDDGSEVLTPITFETLKAAHSYLKTISSRRRARIAVVLP